MVEPLAEKFNRTGEEQDAVALIRTNKENKHYNIGMILGRGLSTIFPHSRGVLTEYGICAYYSKEYREAYDAFATLLSFKNLNAAEVDNAIKNAHFCIDYIKDDYSHYNPEIVSQITRRRAERGSPMITLTMTSCKRPKLFQRTVNSFLNTCTDLDRIDRWLCVDDASSEEDRAEMKRLYPFFEFYWKKPEEKGHPQSMNIIRDMVTTPYFFHMEDDWLFFTRRNYMSECMDVLSHNPHLGQCLINKNYAETAKDYDIIGGDQFTTDTGQRYCVHNYTSTPDSMLAFEQKHGPGKYCSYWAHFSFRPSLLRTRVVKELGRFDENVSHFERDYSMKYVNAGFLSAFFENIYSIHIGRLTSERNDKTKLNAYDLNSEHQFAGKESAVANSLEQEVAKMTPSLPFVMNVLNLQRRPDRWAKFVQSVNIPTDIMFTQYPAIDGKKMVSTPQLQRIFDGNDYNMRVGMVGCAMSHIRTYIELINSGAKCLCIFEDDIEFVPDFKEKLLSVYKQLDEYPEWDILYLGHHLFPKYRTKEVYDKQKMPTIERWSRKESLTKSMGGANGYLISSTGALKLLQYINRVGMTNCIDTMQQKTADDLTVLYASPHLIFCECFVGNNPDLDSDIQFDHGSLTMHIDQRIQEEMALYNNVETELSYEAVEAVAGNADADQVVFYSSDNPLSLAKLHKKSVHPCYFLDNKVLVIVPANSGQSCRKHRLMKDGCFNVDDAIVLQ
jgi:GR25 family glycosyltransferase involved in LPS biosynthesis